MSNADDGETPLAAKLKAAIRRDGAMSVAGFMSACLTDPEHGYYSRQPAIGAGGDFVTAPEISQVFGELIGLWCAVVWQQMGAPRHLNLIELGPGRGTMMRDALRAVRIVPGLAATLHLHLVESNAGLVPLQQAALAGHDVPTLWHETVEACTARLAADPAPLLVLANEFLDTCPAEQFVRHGDRLVPRGIGLDAEGALAFTLLSDRAVTGGVPTHLGEGEILEVQDFGVFDALAPLMAACPAAALFIDYGHATPGAGETLQALRHHRSVSPLTAPGSVDLSVQVDFTRFGAHVRRTPGLAVDGPLPQAQFLGRLGIVERASRLMAANPAKAGAIEAGVQRLMAPTGMGSRFLALGVRSEAVAPLPGFDWPGG